MTFGPPAEYYLRASYNEDRLLLLAVGEFTILYPPKKERRSVTSTVSTREMTFLMCFELNDVDCSRDPAILQFLLY